MQITLYNFEKRFNSTKIPTGGTTYEGYFRNSDPLSMFFPRVRVNFNSESAPPYNYMFIPNMGNRYYWVKNWIHIEGVWEASLEVDVLATFKEEIGNKDLYVLRSSYEFDGAVIDGMYPSKVVQQVQESLTREYRITSTQGGTSKISTPLYNCNFQDGCIVFGLYGPNGTTVNTGITYWLCDVSEFAKLANILMSYDITQNGAWETVSTQIPKDYAKAIADPAQYFAGIYWFPFWQGYISGESQITSSGPRKFGYYELDEDYKATQIVPQRDNPRIYATFATPKHPQANDRGIWLNDSPNTTYHTFFPPFGEFDIPSKALLESTTCVATMYIDLTTGNAKLQLISGQGLKYIGTWNGQVGVPLSITQMTYDPRGILQGATQIVEGVAGAAKGTAQAIGSAFNKAPKTFESQDSNGKWSTKTAQVSAPNAGGIVEGLGDAYKGLKTAVGGALDAVEAAQPTVQNVGSNGSFLDWCSNLWPTIHTKFLIVVDEKNDDIGRPLCKVRKPKNIPGFIVADHGYISTVGTAMETNMVAQFLEGGFFYE